MKEEIKMKTLLSIHSILFLLLVTLCNFGCKEKDTPYSQNQLQKVVDEFLKDKKNILGTIVKFDVHHKQSFTAESGYFDLSRKTPVHPNNKFIIGSITKVFTAVLVLQLAETGKVELQNPIINYLPSDWAEVLAGIKNGGEITVEQVLSHRSGLANITETDEWRKMLTLEPLKERMPIDILKLTQQKGEPEFKPGIGYNYNNTNYLLLGAIIENVSRQPLGVCLQQKIFTRIGMQNTFLSEGTFGSGKDSILHGYYKIEDKIYDGQNVNAGWAWASGGIISTADDLLKFINALVAQRLFEKKETYEQMVRVVGGNEQYGLGLMVFDDPEIGLYYGHGGNFCGTRTMLAYFPKYKVTAVVCHTYCDNNVDPAGCEKLMKLVIKDIFHH